ncbi:MAG: T9SS type A sorting domain-containing protein [Chitinispirillia bacterium]|nr:T9SS type A sorting domain-containing protein [Chitinispirillia bacterium]
MIKRFSLKQLALGFAMILTVASPILSAPCLESGVPVFCQWSSGCFDLDNEKENPNHLGCDQLIDRCRYQGGILYRGVTLSAANDWGAGRQCRDLGGQRVDGARFCLKIYEPAGSSSRCRPIGPDSPVATDFICTNHEGGIVVDDCNALTFVCNFGDGYCDPIPGPWAATPLQCADAGGSVLQTCPTSVCPFGRSMQAASAPLRASYVRGGVVSVSWKSASNISNGTISLINIKGTAVASTPISAGSASISAKLGIKQTLPAGMYFVRVNANDVNGRRIVQQIPVTIVR